MASKPKLNTGASLAERTENEPGIGVLPNGKLNIVKPDDPRLVKPAKVNNN